MVATVGAWRSPAYILLFCCFVLFSLPEDASGVDKGGCAAAGWRHTPTQVAYQVTYL